MMCEFHDCNGNGFRYIWWTDKLFYLSKMNGFGGSLLREMIWFVFQQNLVLI